MAHTNDFLCDACGEFCSTIMVDGKLVPLVVYLVAGVPPDYPGPPVNLNGPGVKVPDLIRELMAQPIARREYCVPCFAKAFNLKLVAAPQAK
jgi:hypothetical protein